MGSLPGTSDAARALASSSSALIITGAGLSADSGLPTYRGIGGLYNSGRTEEGIPIEVALSGHTMQTNPELAWKYIAQVEEAGRGAAPNAGHDVIAGLESRLDRVVVLTQNVDGLHLRAGSSNVIDIHGDVRHLHCVRCAHRETRDSYADLAIPPTCPECGSLVRPDVVLFGEMLPTRKVKQMSAELTRGFDIVFSIGTSSLFPYIATPFIRARAAGLPTVEINPEETDVSDAASIRIESGAAEALSSIWDQLDG